MNQAEVVFDKMVQETTKRVPVMRIPKFANFVMFQLCWFASVLGAVKGHTYLGPVVALIVAGLHLMAAKDRKGEVLFLSLACLFGTTVDMIVMQLGAFSFAVEPSVPWGYPLWMSALWLGFATTIRSSLSWLSKRCVLAAVFGFIGGPLAYASGEKLGAILVSENILVSYFFIGIFWALVTPGLFALSNTLGTASTEKLQ